MTSTSVYAELDKHWGDPVGSEIVLEGQQAALFIAEMDRIFPNNGVPSNRDTATKIRVVRGEKCRTFYYE